MSARQRALSIGDVLLTIADQVISTNTDEPLFPDDRRCLLHLGLVCKAFWTVLEPRIWRVVSVDMIACQIPHATRRGATDDLLVRTVTNAESALRERPITENTLRALARYYPHIRVLDLYEWNDHLTWALILLQELGTSLQASRFQPDVARLCVFNELTRTGSLPARALEPFMGPQLEFIELFLGWFEESPRMLLEAIGRHCTGLRQFVLDCTKSEAWESIPEMLSDTILQSCISLETIKVDVVHPCDSIWFALARLPKLRTIDFTSPELNQRNLIFPPESSTPQAFQRLEELSVHEYLDPDVPKTQAIYGDRLRIFIPAVFAPLRKLELFCIGGSNVCALASLIVERWESSLEQIDLFVNWGPSESTSRSFREVVQQLHVLRHLRGFGIHNTYPFDLVDSDIDQLTKAWPDLERLQFSCPTFRSPQDPADLHLSRRSIHTIAKAYPNLKALAVPINYALPFSELPPDATVPTCPNVRLWDCADSFFGPDSRESLRGVSRFMLRYLPELRGFWGVQHYTLRKRREVIADALHISGGGTSLKPHYVSSWDWDDIHNPHPPHEPFDPSDWEDVDGESDEESEANESETPEEDE